MKIDENILSKLTNEQKKKVEDAKTPEELLAIAKEAGYELSPEQLEAVSGGENDWCTDKGCKEVCYGDGSCIADCYQNR